MTTPRLFEGAANLGSGAQRLPPPPSTEPTHLPGTFLEVGPDRVLLEVFERATDPTDAIELRDLYVGRVEHALGGRALRPDLAARWTNAARRRSFSAEEILASPAIVPFVKEMFNFYFRDDLYGALRSADHLVLSSGAVDEVAWGLPTTVKSCIQYALDRDWYGYSDSRGREPAREAIARYETERLPAGGYEIGNVALTMGGTFAVSSVSDLVLSGTTSTAPALCAIPNYPPLVASVARRTRVQLVPTPSVDGVTSIRSLIAQVRPDTPLVLLQTAANPTGALVPESELEELVGRAGRTTMIVLDECHEWLGPPCTWSPVRAASNVVRVNSLSKNWSAPGLKVGWLLASQGFIDDYYEYASTSFGGPPSFFYTAVEVLARMERWRTQGLADVGPGELAEFEADYGLGLDSLMAAYHSYLAEREERERELVALRDFATSRVRATGIEVDGARYSINVAMRVPGYEDSYGLFRELLHSQGVSLFPGLLTFCLSGGIARMTTARPGNVLTEALRRFEAFVAGLPPSALEG